VFISILIVSGYNVLPAKRCFYWQSATDVCNELIYQSMRRDRFIQIIRFMHFADNTQPDTSDKMWKLRPLMIMLKRKFQELFRPTKQLSNDESMVPYNGRRSCKRFIRGKPTRFGYKVWCLNTCTGYLVNFEAYRSIPRTQIPFSSEHNKCPLQEVSTGLVRPTTYIQIKASDGRRHHVCCTRARYGPRAGRLLYRSLD